MLDRPRARVFMRRSASGSAADPPEVETGPPGATLGVELPDLRLGLGLEILREDAGRMLVPRARFAPRDIAADLLAGDDLLRRRVPDDIVQREADVARQPLEAGLTEH